GEREGEAGRREGDHRQDRQRHEQAPAPPPRGRTTRWRVAGRRIGGWSVRRRGWRIARRAESGRRTGGWWRGRARVRGLVARSRGRQRSAAHGAVEGAVRVGRPAAWAVHGAESWTRRGTRRSLATLTCPRRRVGAPRPPTGRPALGSLRP